MFSLTLEELASHIISLAVAYALALPIGWNREKEERSAGIRTFPLVAMAACGFVLIAIGVLGKDSTGQARILEGLMVGIGFIGGGAILKHGTHATCTATAASVWATGAVGGAVGYGLYDVATILSLSTYLTLRYLAPLKKVAHNGAPHQDGEPSALRLTHADAKGADSDDLSR